MRTAYLCDPYTCTCATPDTVEMRCARYVSPYSLSSVSGMVGETSAMYRMGDAEGSTFR